MIWKKHNLLKRVLDDFDFWWDNIDYIIAFTDPIYDMIRVTNTDKPSLHLVYDMWDMLRLVSY